MDFIGKKFKREWMGGLWTYGVGLTDKLLREEFVAEFEGENVETGRQGRKILHDQLVALHASGEGEELAALEVGYGNPGTPGFQRFEEDLVTGYPTH